MSKGSRKARALVAAMAMGLASSAAAAPGNGIRLGGSEGRLHPFVEVEGRYDSNALFETDGAAVDDLILHVRPGVTLDVPGDETAVKLRAALDWAQYLGVSGDTTDLSKLYGEASLGVGLNRRGAIGLEISDDFRRTNGTTALSLGSAVVSNDNRLRVAVPWKPGGGALVLTVAGDWRLETFEPLLDCEPGNTAPECDADTLADLGYNELGGSAELKWKFLPRTAAVLDAGYFARLPNEPALSAEVSGLRTQAGVTGLMSPRVAGTIKGGYGRSFGDVAVNTWLASAELEWLASETTSARVGYSHDLGVDPGSDVSVYLAHRAYLEGKVLLAGRFTAKVLGQLDARDYQTGAELSATLFRIEPSVEAEVTRWLRVGVGYAYTDRGTDLDGEAVDTPGLEYSKSEAWLKLTATY